MDDKLLQLVEIDARAAEDYVRVTGGFWAASSEGSAGSSGSQ